MTRTGSAETSAAGSRPPSRASLASATERVLNRGGWSNPDVLLVRHQGALVAVKDFAPRSAWVRGALAPWLSAREGRAWQALHGHPAVPRFLGRVDRLAFATEYRPGATLFSQRGEPLPAPFLSELEEAVAEMHRHGVVHGDLSNRTNVLRDEAGHVVLIDFGSALVFRPGGLAARLLLPLCAALDRRALRKWRAKQKKRLGA